MIKQEEFEVAIGNNNIQKVKLLLKEPSVDPTDRDYDFIFYASKEGYADIVKLLLEDGRANPCILHNSSIRYAFKNNHNDIVKMLWETKNVKKTLKTDYTYLYNKLKELDIQKKILNFN